MDSPDSALQDGDLITHPHFGDTFTFLGGLCFFFLCMLLPLVGPAGSVTTHYWPQNVLTFLGVLLLSIAFSAIGFWSKQVRRRTDHSPFPRVSAMLTGFYSLLLLVFLVGGLKI